jgi:hypothetical protein
MAVDPTREDLSHGELERCYQRAIDATTVEEAVVCHSDIIDLLDMQLIVALSSHRSAARKRQLIEKIRTLASYHRDAVDRLTDLIERKQQFVWHP